MAYILILFFIGCVGAGLLLSFYSAQRAFISPKRENPEEAVRSFFSVLIRETNRWQIEYLPWNKLFNWFLFPTEEDIETQKSNIRKWWLDFIKNNLIDLNFTISPDSVYVLKCENCNEKDIAVKLFGIETVDKSKINLKYLKNIIINKWKRYFSCLKCNYTLCAKCYENIGVAVWCPICNTKNFKIKETCPAVTANIEIYLQELIEIGKENDNTIQYEIVFVVIGKGENVGSAMKTKKILIKSVLANGEWFLMPHFQIK